MLTFAADFFYAPEFLKKEPRKMSVDVQRADHENFARALTAMLGSGNYKDAPGFGQISNDRKKFLVGVAATMRPKTTFEEWKIKYGEIRFDDRLNTEYIVELINSGSRPVGYKFKEPGVQAESDEYLYLTYTQNTFGATTYKWEAIKKAVSGTLSPSTPPLTSSGVAPGIPSPQPQTPFEQLGGDGGQGVPSQLAPVLTTAAVTIGGYTRETLEKADFKDQQKFIKNNKGKNPEKTYKGGGKKKDVQEAALELWDDLAGMSSGPVVGSDDPVKEAALDVVEEHPVLSAVQKEAEETARRDLEAESLKINEEVRKAAEENSKPQKKEKEPVEDFDNMKMPDIQKFITQNRAKVSDGANRYKLPDSTKATAINFAKRLQKEISELPSNEPYHPFDNEFDFEDFNF